MTGVLIPESFVAQVARDVYGIALRQIEALPPFFDWRGIYRLHVADNRSYLLRLIRHPDAADGFAANAGLLQWLAQQEYAAPRVIVTRDNQLVGHIQGWTALLLSYIEGSVLDVHDPDVGLLGAALGRLHTLDVPADLAIARSAFHPTLIEMQTAPQLTRDTNTLPPATQVLVAALRDAVTPLLAQPAELRVTHRDCWYKNAIKTAPDAVVLIDWDPAGIGLPVLDLGYLLLTSHYDLAEPLRGVARAATIHDILRGYLSTRPLSQTERTLLPQAIAFPLALHLGEHLSEHPHIESDDFFIRKLQARFAATAAIAEIADAYLAGERS